MNTALTKAALGFLAVSLLLSYSVAVFVRCKTVPTFLQLVGASCLVVVVLTHIAEALNLFEAMRWGEPDSLGHYLDLSSAVIGVTLLAVGVLLRMVRTRASPL